MTPASVWYMLVSVCAGTKEAQERGIGRDRYASQTLWLDFKTDFDADIADTAGLTMDRPLWTRPFSGRPWHVIKRSRLFVAVL
ncbi:hypothetical protein CC78DRAFT_535054 [Lojkania enalia]|uniref:Uncharacterized protein n=1 Tax=Lojkania enalia TaxID=147567 RepID=A0A9P4MY76_9PLEO|nr:hypothetical protein CC78DRAFT_535054 [Didymosphaeria enalia]